MPIYKLSRRVTPEQRDQLIQGRVRLVALLISAGLFLATAVLLLTHAAHHSV